MQHPESPPTLAALFGGFFWIGVLGFGGVLPLARRSIVEQHRWLSAAEFTDLLALCQFLPGPNIVNVSVALGGRFRGPSGSVAAVAGLLGAPVAIVLVLGGLYGRYANIAAVAHGFAGLTAAASGLVLATALRLAGPLRAHPASLAIAAAGCVAVAVLRLPLLPVLAVLAGVGVTIEWRRR